MRRIADKALWVIAFLAGTIACMAVADGLPSAVQRNRDSTAATAPSAGERLEVSGAILLYGGKPVFLRGVAVEDPIHSRKKRPLSDYAIIANDWNANVVRISTHPYIWKRTPHDQVIQTLKNNVNAALAAGMFVIIDWHTIGWPDGYYEKPEPSWGDPMDLYDSNFALAKSFWGDVAGAFGRDGRIAFELWNEPVFQEDEPSDPGNKVHWKELKTYLEQLVAVVRERSANLILATGDQWAYDLRGIKEDPIRDVNTAYTWHVYAGNDDNDPKLWAANLDALQKVKPVLVTEWGFQPGVKEHYAGTAESFGNKFVRDFLDGKNLHSTAWSWHADCGPDMLKKNWKTPTVYGQFVMAYLKTHKADRPFSAGSAATQFIPSSEPRVQHNR